jgi:hypothetical protein
MHLAELDNLPEIANGDLGHLRPLPIFHRSKFMWEMGRNMRAVAAGFPSRVASCHSVLPGQLRGALAIYNFGYQESMSSNRTNRGSETPE